MRIGSSCGVWLFSGGCVHVGVLGKGLVVVILWTRVRSQFDFRCPRWYWYAYGCLHNFGGVWLVSGGCLYVGVLGKGLVVVILWTCGGGSCSSGDTVTSCHGGGTKFNSW